MKLSWKARENVIVWMCVIAAGALVAVANAWELVP